MNSNRRKISFQARSGMIGKGFTLVELLAACATLAILGIMLASMMYNGLNMWRQARSRREAYDIAQTVFTTLRDDLASLKTVEVGNDTDVHVWMICNRDENNRQRLSFVRGPSKLEASVAGRNKGLMSVMYYQVPNGDGLVSLHRITTSSLDDTEETDDQDIVVAHDLMYLGFLFWTPETKRWDIPVSDPSNTGPEDQWDSTRGMNGFESFRYHVYSADSANYRFDDVFPELIRVTVVVEPRDYRATFCQLTTDIGPTSTDIGVSNTTKFPADDSLARKLATISPVPTEHEHHYLEQLESLQHVRIEDEWIRYSNLGPNSLTIEPGGRGARGTIPADHGLGAEVHVGQPFTFTFRIPWHHRPNQHTLGCSIE